MSDTRFIILGIGLIFAGFIVVGVFGAQYFGPTIEAEQFGDCYEYFDDKPPVPVDCENLLQGKIMIVGFVVGLILAGILSLIKGAKGSWDQNVKPEDIVGPGGNNSDKSEKD